MFTRCPSCQTLFRIDLERLRAARGEVLCQSCHRVFNALEALSDTPDEAGREPTQHGGDHPRPKERDDGLPSFSVYGGRRPERRRPGERLEEIAGNESSLSGPQPGWISKLGWVMGIALLIALLMLQVAVFEGPRLAQQEGVRPWLDLTCRALGCALPGFRKVPSIRIIDRGLFPAPDNIDGFEFSLVMTNEARLPQTYPSIRLVLTGVNGTPVASRVFKPQDYLATVRPGTMPVGEPVAIRLLLARPSREIGGFSFELL